MADTKILPRQLPANSTPPSGAVTIVDDGTSVNKTTLAQLGDAIGAVRSIGAGANVSVDVTDPLNPIINAVGSGDMLASMYDPDGIQSNAFNMQNMEDGTTKVAMTNVERSKLAGIAAGAQVNTVNTVNGYTGSVVLTKADVGLGDVDNTSDANKPISISTQTALDEKSDKSITIGAGEGLAGGGTLESDRSIALNSASIASLAKADSAIQASALGALAYKSSVDISDINATGTPSTTSVLFGNGEWRVLSGGGDMLASVYDPQNIAADVFSRSNQTGTQPASTITGLTKASVGLGNVDNTSDASKPISTATQTALNGKFNNPSGTVNQVLNGLGDPVDPPASGFDSVSSLLSDTSLNYTNDPVGSYVQTISEQFVYISVPSSSAFGPSGYHIQTAGGYKLRVVEGSLEAYGNPPALGVSGSIPPVKVLDVKTDIVGVAEPENRGNVVFYGEGSVPDWYKRTVASEITDGTLNMLTLSDLDPAKHLKKFSSVASPVVVAFGSSSAAEIPDSITNASTVVGRIHRAFVDANPSKNIKFYGRGVGGQSFTGMDGALGSISKPAWYDDGTRAWIDYIGDLSPDVVVVIAGSNDSANISVTRVQSVYNKLKALPSNPDVIFVTQPAPSLAAAPGYEAYSTEAGQEGRDYAAGVVRTFAKSVGAGILDVNRLAGIVIDGRDILDCSFERTSTTISVPETGSYVHPEQMHDYVMQVSFTGDVDATFGSSATYPPFFRVGRGGQNISSNTGDIIQVRKSSLGKIQLNCFQRDGSTSSNYNTFISHVDFPEAPFSFEVSKIANTFSISVVGTQYNTRIMIPIRAAGGIFNPTTGISGTLSLPHPWTSIGPFSTGKNRLYVPKITAAEAWGESFYPNRMDPLIGGNGINHLSDKGTEHVLAPLLQSQYFRSFENTSSSTSGSYTPLATAGVNTASAVPSIARWIRIGNIVTVSGTVVVTPSAAGMAQFTMSLPIPTDILGDVSLSGTVSSTTISGRAWGSPTAERMQIGSTFLNTTAVTFGYSVAYEVV